MYNTSNLLHVTSKLYKNISDHSCIDVCFTATVGAELTVIYPVIFVWILSRTINHPYNTELVCHLVAITAEIGVEGDINELSPIPPAYTIYHK